MSSVADPPDTVRPAYRLGGWVARCLLVPGVIASTTCAHAGDWEITPRVDVRQIYSDNIELLPEPDARHDWVTEVVPGIDIQGGGSRVDASIFYSAQGLYYARGTSDSDLNHRLQANVTTEVVEELLFVDVDANARQELIDNRGRVSRDNINVTGNRQDVFTVAISPYLRRRFGSYADATLRFRFGAVINESSDGGSGRDSDLRSVVLNVDSGTYFQRFTWSFVADYREEQPQESAESDRQFTRIRANGRYRINRKWAALTGLGYENNDYDGSTESDKVTWRLGGAFTPNPRFSLEGGVEDRTFGIAPFLQMRYRKRRILATASYQEEITSSNQLEADRRLVSTTDGFGRPIPPDSSTLLDNPTDVPSADNQVFVQRRFSGTLTYGGPRNTASLTGFWVTRDYEVTGDQETDTGVTGSITHQFNALLSGRILGSWQDTELRGGDKRTRWDIGASITRNLGRTFSITGDVRHFEQTGDRPLDEYDENRASILLSKTF